MVYFVRAEVTGLVKIGFTQGDPAARMADLQVGSPVRLTLLGAVPGDRSDEQALHRRFAHARSHGEWFYPCPDLLSYLESAIPKQQEPDDALDAFWHLANCAAGVRHRQAFNDWKNRLYLALDRLEDRIRALPGSREEGDIRWENTWESFEQAKDHVIDIPLLME